MEKSADSVNFHVSLTRSDKSGKQVTATDKFVSNNAHYVVSHLQDLVRPGYGNSEKQMAYFKTYIDEDNDSVKYKHVKGNVFNVTYNIKRFPGNLSVDTLINPNRQQALYLTLRSGSETKASKAVDARAEKWLAGLNAGAKYTVLRTGKNHAFYIESTPAGLTASIKVKTVKISVSLSGYDMQVYKAYEQARQRGQMAQIPERFYADESVIAKHANDIIAWYKARAFGPYTGDYVKIFDLKHVKGSIFQVKYNINEKWVSINGLVDPDQSGNYPIEYDGKTLLVSGSVIGKARASVQAASPFMAASPKAKAASPKAKAASPKAKAASPRGCTLQTDKKYAARKSPSYPANECCGATMAGNDGKLYKSAANKNGVCRWVLA